MTAPSDMTSIVDKIRKLFALATSSNPNEAALAAAKAQELLLQHNLTLSQIETQEPASTYKRNWFEVGSRVWRRSLLTVIARHNFCDVVHCGRGRMAIIGEQHNSEAVQFIYAHLVTELEPMAVAAYLESWGDVPAITWKDGFFMGAVQSIHARLEAQRKQSEASSQACRALVVTKDTQLQDAIQRFYPDVRTARAKSVKSTDGFYQGVEAGKHVTLNKVLAS